MRQHWATGGVLHRNDWFHDWLLDNEISTRAGAYQAAKDHRLLDDLINRAARQQSQPVVAPGGHGIVAGRSLDLTGYLACGHPDCLTRQVDDLFARVWHYFDKIAIVGPDAHSFLEALSVNRKNIDVTAREIAVMAEPIFHIRRIGADELVTWVAKPPSCAVHWRDFTALQAYDLPSEIEHSVALALLSEGSVRLEKHGNKSQIRLLHKQLFGGSSTADLQNVLRRREHGESVEMTLARRIVMYHWAGAASDMYAAHSMGLPLGLGIGLEARLASLRRDAISPADVAFNLRLPVVDGLPVRELIALRENEFDAFENFRDTLTRAIKDKLASANAAEDPEDVAREIQEDEINPALHKIQQRLHAAEGVLRRNHRYNIALAGLSTVCGVLGSTELAIALGVAAATGTAAVEGLFVTEKKGISLDGMYFLWRAKEYTQSKSQPVRAKKGQRGKR